MHLAIYKSQINLQIYSLAMRHILENISLLKTFEHFALIKLKLVHLTNDSFSRNLMIVYVCRSDNIGSINLHSL